MKHPGKTAAQRRVLDEIGCGNFSPIADRRTINAMLSAGLIVELPPRIEPVFGNVTMKVRQFEMPIPVHYAWCKSMSDEADTPA